MNASIIAGLLRTLVAAGAAYAAGKGVAVAPFLTPEVQTAIVTAGVMALSAHSKVKASKKQS